MSPELGLVVSVNGPVVTRVEHMRRPSETIARCLSSIVPVFKRDYIFTDILVSAYMCWLM